MSSNTVSLNIKIKPQTKQQLVAVADEFGMTTTSLVNSMITQVVRTRRLVLDASEDDPEPSEFLKSSIAGSEVDYQNGRSSRFANVDDLLEHLHGVKA